MVEHGGPRVATRVRCRADRVQSEGVQSAGRGTP